MSNPAAPVTGPRTPIAAGPRTQSSLSNPAAQVTAPPRTTSTPTGPRAPITGRMLAMKMGTVDNAQQATAQLLESDFDNDEVTQFDGVLGERGARRDADDEPSIPDVDFDGKTPAPAVTARDTFKAVIAPVQSREGRRSQELYRLALDQFAVGHNARYDSDAPDKPRAHIFVWDVTRAMNCEIPKFVGGRELSLGLMVDWLRHEGVMRGWRRADEVTAVEAANSGMPVVVVPKEVRLKLMGMARPGGANVDGKPFIAAAAVGRGNQLSVKEAFGVFAVEYFVHE